MLPRHTSATHAFESGPRDGAGGRPAQVFIHDLDVAPAQMLQAVLHRILQPLALEIVSDLVRGGLTYIEHRFARHMLRLDLLTHGPPPAVQRALLRRGHGADGPAAGSSCPGSPAAAFETAEAEVVLVDGETGSAARVG